MEKNKRIHARGTKLGLNAKPKHNAKKRSNLLRNLFSYNGTQAHGGVF
jgi:hypothetical protein